MTTHTHRDRRLRSAFLCALSAVLFFVPAFGRLWAEVPVDEHLLVVLSDIHQGRDFLPFGFQYYYDYSMKNMLRRGLAFAGKNFSGKEQRLRWICEQIASMNPHPAKVLILGDIAFQIGSVDNYRMAKKSLDILTAAGIPWQATMGNHDDRLTFLEVFPEQRLDPEPVPNRMVRIVEMPEYDILVLDSHQPLEEPIDQDNPGDGYLNRASLAWLKGQVEDHDRRNRPYCVASHHPLFFYDIGLRNILLDSPMFTEYWHGHIHRWRTDVSSDGFRSVSFPATSYPGGIQEPLGFVLVRADETGRKLNLTLITSSEIPRPSEEKPDEESEGEDLFEEE
ncbi:MAG: metallophosphoesterase [Thermoguttaceae bacterium]|nr:metallophosphoesterase [Thermoguttaceae bacterium]MBQ6620633.1 metallophosphoesterase [Thermoguttaceae bacterium]